MNDEIKTKISIVVPFYNTGGLIKHIVDSFINQTMKDFEVIFVNDGSTDDTKLKLEGLLSDCNLSFTIIDQLNKGVSAARNVGLEKAQGEYVCFCDSDDFVSSSLVEDLLSFITDDFDLVIFGHDIVDIDFKLIKSNLVSSHAVQETGQEILTSFLLRNIVLSVASVVFRKKFLLQHKLLYNENLSFGEDQEFNMLALYKADKVGVLNKQLVSYVKHSDSATAQKFDRTRYGYIEKYDKLINCIESDNTLLNQVYESKVGAAAYICTMICQNFNLKEAMSELAFLHSRYLTDINPKRFTKQGKMMYMLIKFLPFSLYFLIKSGRFRKIWFSAIFNLKNT
jgi:glycosyltransferase involved in cell wall biosynthesis